MRAYAVSSLTYGKHKLPFKDVSSPAKFEIVERFEKGVRDSGTSSDEDDPDDVEEVKQRRGGADDDDDGKDIDSEIVVSDIEDGASEEKDVTLRNSVKKKGRQAAKVSAKVGKPSPQFRPLISYEVSNATGNHLQHYAQFFKELDWTLTDPIHGYNRGGDSIVVGLLGKLISTNAEFGSIPEAEFKYNWISYKSYCKKINFIT